MSPVATIRGQLITDAVVQVLQALPSLTVYRSEVPDQPPKMPDSDRVAPYAVLYPFPGKPGPGGDLAGVSNDLDYGCQITVAAGYSQDCEAAVDRVHGAMYLLSPVVNGVVLGQFRPPIGYDPGPIRVDRTITPPRSSLPLQYRLIATAN